MNPNVYRARLAALSLVIAAALPSLVCVSSFAQTSANPQLKKMFVTATRSAQPVGDVVADVSINVIERTGAAGLADVLARVSGIEIA